MPKRMIWIDPDGGETELTEEGSRWVSWGSQGLLMPPVSVVEDEVPLQPGAKLRLVKIGARDVELPMVFKEASEAALDEALHAWLRRLDPTRGDGKLKVVSASGQECELVCRYVGNLLGDEDEDASGQWWQKAVIVFRGSDPYWYATSPVVNTYVVGTPATFFPVLPMRLASSTIFADVAVTNVGDVEAWPIWTITGPGSDLVLRNLTTGKLLRLTYTLGAGQSVVIDTRAGKKSVRLGDGTNLFPNCGANPSLWSLVRGANSVRIEMNGATAASSVVLSYYPKYNGVVVD